MSELSASIQKLKSQQKELKSQRKKRYSQIRDLNVTFKDTQRQIDKLELPEKQRICTLESIPKLSKYLQLPLIAEEWLSNQKLSFEFTSDFSHHIELKHSIDFYLPTGELGPCLYQFATANGCQSRIISSYSTHDMTQDVEFALSKLSANANQLTIDDWNDLITSGNDVTIIAMIFALAINRFADIKSKSNVFN